MFNTLYECLCVYLYEHRHAANVDGRRCYILARLSLCKSPPGGSGRFMGSRIHPFLLAFLRYTLFHFCTYCRQHWCISSRFIIEILTGTYLRYVKTVRMRVENFSIVKLHLILC